MTQTEEAVWRTWVEKSLRLCTQVGKSGQWRLLAASPLPHVGLFADRLIAHEHADPVLVGQNIYATLLWGVEQLKPTTAPDWQAFRWRAYNVLYYPYFTGMAFAELAERLQISEPTVYQSRRSALQQLVQLLHHEAKQPQHHQERQRTLTGCQYRFYPPPVQALLCLAAALPPPITHKRFVQILQQQLPCWVAASTANSQPTAEAFTLSAADLHAWVRQLLTDGALLYPPTADGITIAPRFGDYLSIGQASALTQAHRLLAQQCNAEVQSLEAAWHYQQAGDHECAATLLLSAQQRLINEGQTPALLALLQSIARSRVRPVVWAQIKILLGDLALQQQEVRQALAEYQQALTVEDIEVRALAYYRRARAFLALNLDETLWHYELALATLAPISPDHPLLNRIQTDKAWFFIQEKPDLLKAEELLTRLEQSMSKENQLGRSYLANAWAGFWHRRANDALALQHRLEAWLLANTAQDQVWMMHTARNLGNDYTALRAYDKALEYFAQSLQLAAAIGDQAMVGLGEKAIGGCYFWLADYDRSISHYQRAYALLTQLGRQNWLASVCYDLAEVYATRWDFDAMQRYWQQGLHLCATLRNETLTRLFHELDASVAWRHQLNQRQWQALLLLKQAGYLTNRSYQSHTGCQQRQAVRDLNELCALGLVERVGQGRSVQYIAAK